MGHHKTMTIRLCKGCPFQFNQRKLSCKIESQTNRRVKYCSGFQSRTQPQRFSHQSMGLNMAAKEHTALSPKNGNLQILWMDEILHHLRNPGMMTFLYIPTNNRIPQFPSCAGFRPSTAGGSCWASLVHPKKVSLF